MHILTNFCVHYRHLFFKRNSLTMQQYRLRFSKSVTRKFCLLCFVVFAMQYLLRVHFLRSRKIHSDGP